MEGFQQAMEAGTSPAVKIWMNWMTIIFLAAIPFAIKHVQARWAVLALVLTGIGAVIVWTQTQNVHLLGIVHLVVWLPLAIYLWRSVLSQPEKKQFRFFFTWAVLIFATICISLVFDVRDIYLVLTGAK